MGNFSIWHWLILIAVSGVLIGAIPIAFASPVRTLSRRPYALRTLAAFLAMLVLSSLTKSAGGGSAFLSIIDVIVSVVLWIQIVVWSVHRVNNIGWSKWWCLLILLPLVNIVFWFVLLFKIGEQRDARMVEAFD
ncbi:MAG: DUF805 domain-containing protein [Kiloniellaceae bacterium]